MLCSDDVRLWRGNVIPLDKVHCGDIGVVVIRAFHGFILLLEFKSMTMTKGLRYHNVFRQTDATNLQTRTN